MVLPRIRNLVAPLCFLLVVSSWLVSDVDCAKKAPAASAPPPAPEATIEEVSAKQLERLLEDKDYVAVYWYARSCTTCDTVLAELEHIDDDTDSFGVDFVKINDKRLAKQYGITKFPALTYFREKEPIIYEGDLMDEAGVLDFLTSLEAMDLPDRIEEVNSKILAKIIEDSDYVAVLFYKPECKKCIKALQELENIDDEADQLDIGFVKIHDEDLAEEYNLGPLPKLVYYRHQTPIVYEHELQREEDVLEWLVENKATGDEDDIIEEVNAKTLKTLIQNIDNLVVLFYDEGDDESESVLLELENIDDDCAKHGIQFVRIDDPKVSKEYGIDEVPAIVYFEKQIPNVYDDDLSDEEEILEWLLSQLEKDEIEDVTDEMLDKLIKEGKSIAVLFYDNNDKKSEKVLNELENIDDECDQLGINFVKMDDLEEAKDYGVTKFPKLVYFEQGIPTVYEGSLEQEEDVLEWLERQTSSDEIEDVTDEMLDMIVEKMTHVAVLFYDKDSKTSQKVLAELENIDDECDQNDIAFVKIDDDNEAREWGIEELPTMILFERGIPHIYEGDLLKEDELLGWLVHQKRHSEIPEITDEMKDKLMQMYDHVAIIFYDKDDKQDIRVLNELENIDDELEKEEIVIARLDNAEEAREYGLDHLPALVYFENEIPAIYEGDLMNEEEVLEWLKLQKYSATIEEVTDEILQDLIEDHEYVCVYFSGECEEGEKCDKILDDLENIDDELDEAGIIFVTTEDMVTAKKYNVKNLPSLVFFRNKDPLIYSGDLNDEDEVLAWLTDEETLEIPGKIEEVNIKMLEKILYENEHIVVFFYHDDDKKAQKIIAELENIDDECEEKDIDFVKTSDDDIDKEYDLESLPALVFYRNKFRTIYTGDLMKEEEILEWVLQQYNTKPEIIESVDRKTLQVLVNEVEHLAVLFYDDECETCPKILEKLETIDDDTDKHHIQFVKANDEKLAHEIGIFSFPALVYYETGVPIMYDGNLKNEKRILQWLIDHKNNKLPKPKLRKRYTDDVEDLDREDRIDKKRSSGAKKLKPIPRLDAVEQPKAQPGAKAAPAKPKDKPASKPAVKPAKPTASSNKPAPPPAKPKKTTLAVDDDDDEGDLLNEYDVLDWMHGQKTDESIQDVERDELLKFIDTKDFLAVVFYVEEDPDTPKILRHIELIDDEAADYGILMVKSSDRLMAKKFGFRNPPGVTYFRKGKSINYDGDIDDEEELLDWLTNPHNMEMTDHIEKVNRKMFQKIRQASDYLAVFFYSDDCKQCPRVLAEIEHIDDEADGAGINFVKIDDKQMAKELGVYALPGIVFFKLSSKEPVIYAGDLNDEDEILNWLMTQKNPGGDIIEDLDGTKLLGLIQDSNALAVYFYTDECEQCTGVLESLENIDDDCDRHGIMFVKTDDLTIAEQYGITDYPVLVYFEDNVPNVFEGSLDEEEEVLQWLITQKTEDRIELITRVMLESMVDETQYLAVYFYKINCNICDQILEGLEVIDDELDVFGIHMVKIQDPQLAKRYSIKTFPALVYFRNGNPLIYEGDLQNEQSVLEWLVDDDNRELADEIEEVNERMLDRLMEQSPLLCVFYYDEDCAECDDILEELELIDGEVDLYGIDFVKVASLDAAHKYGVTTIPSLVYYRKQIPMLYDGDMHDHERVMNWLTSQDVFEIKNEIEEVNRKMLNKLLDENEFVAVYFFEQDHEESEAVLEKLELIDSETDNLDITFVKMGDPRYARKWGVTKLPAIVYFRKRFPSIYRGDMYEEQDVLEWLRKNRFRQPELNIFMYALIALGLGFVIYTAFLLQCFKPAPPAPVPHPKQN
uniref:Thioredoxin domain-containing protein n=1 Tax=Anopheles atroparvus TaxID=41427 RepID=A0AAG5DAU9_ANOAO